MILLLIMTFVVIALLEVPDLIRQKYWRELTVFSFLFAAGFILALLLSFGVKIPSPAKAIEHLYNTIFT